MTTFMEALHHLVGITEEDHHTEYGGTVYVTPPLTEYDNGKENDGEEAQGATVRTPRT